MYDHLSPEEALIQAWLRPGPHPAAHAAAQTELLLVARRIMPLVYKALMRLNSEREKKIMREHHITAGIYTDRIAAPLTEEESRRKAQDLYNTAVDADRNAMSSTGEESRRWHRKAQVYASLALVEAQEAANEQARIGNLIAMAESGRTTVNGARAALSALYTGSAEEGSAHMALLPEIAQTLGIKEIE